MGNREHPNILREKTVKSGHLILDLLFFFFLSVFCFIVCHETMDFYFIYF